MTKRNLQAFQQMEAATVLDSKVIRRRVRLKQLIDSPTYADLKAMAAEIVSPAAAAIPNTNGGIAGVIGYFSFSVIRDALNQFFEAVEREAAQAPSLEEALHE